MNWLLYLCVPLLTWTAWSALTLWYNWKSALRLNLPIVIAPVSPLNVLWLAACALTNAAILVRHFLGPFGSWASFTYIGWQFDHGHEARTNYGPAFVLCTPGLNELFIADAAAAHSVLTRRKAFIKPAMLYESINVFGRNLDSAEGENWQRQRKLTAPNFNERVSSSVWAEARRQASQMLDVWMKNGDEGSSELEEDVSTLALHVLSNAGFGRQQDFLDAQREAKAPYRLTYHNSLITVLKSFILITILPVRYMTLQWMPKSIHRIGVAAEDFVSYMKEMVKEERTSSVAQKMPANNLLSALVHASENISENEKGTKELAEDEIYGNIFVYNLAGYETTANALATAIAYLAAAPTWQEWIGEEVILASSASDYETIFPQFKRCLAVMFETLRLHGSVVHIPKTTGQFPQILKIGEKEHIIPAGTFVTVNSHALHCDTQTWGPDAADWRPSRWIKHIDAAGMEELLEPLEGSFVPWADGPRVCPGKKFSQVEFVAVISTLFRDHRVRPVRRKGESDESVHTRLRGMIQDSGITGLTLQMRHPGAVPLAWFAVNDGY